MNEFIAIDFETAIYSRESAISIGLVKYRDYQPIDTFYSLIRPPKLYIRPDFTDIHGLTIDDEKDAPNFDSVWESGIKKFIGGTMLAAHLEVQTAQKPHTEAHRTFGSRSLRTQRKMRNLDTTNLPP